MMGTTNDFGSSLIRCSNGLNQSSPHSQCESERLREKFMIIIFWSFFSSAQ